jgi:oxaloacetate decarboxylase gamma subunit
MEGDFGTASMLLAVGMITVFSVLFLVVFLGSLLIRIVNKFQKEIPVEIKRHTQNIDAGKLAAIIAAVEVKTSGKGQVVSVTRIKDNNNF